MNKAKERHFESLNRFFKMLHKIPDDWTIEIEGHTNHQLDMSNSSSPMSYSIIRFCENRFRGIATICSID